MFLSIAAPLVEGALHLALIPRLTELSTFPSNEPHYFLFIMPHCYRFSDFLLLTFSWAWASTAPASMLCACKRGWSSETSGFLHCHLGAFITDSACFSFITYEEQLDEVHLFGLEIPPGSMPGVSWNYISVSSSTDLPKNILFIWMQDFLPIFRALVWFEGILRKSEISFKIWDLSLPVG